MEELSLSSPLGMLVLVHALCGMVALFVPIAALLAHKGGKLHKFSGRTYLIAMFTLSVTAIPLSFFQWNSVLLIILFLSFYLTASGYRLVQQHRSKEQTPRAFDSAARITLTMAALLVAAISCGYDELSTAVLTGMFATASIAVSAFDRKNSQRLANSKQWLISHMSRMLAAYTLTITVYSILNFEFMSLAMRCFCPIFAGGLASLLYVRYHWRKLNRA